jgi:hypothetical protein
MTYDAFPLNRITTKLQIFTTKEIRGLVGQLPVLKTDTENKRL